ncbi:hypothetical protein [Streptomyces lavendulocolor]|uniref:hypothetical protein n=1 Tax=Streptomyces lavendulocolor TaxID=67316 RepID=UPI003C2F6CEB
MSAKNNTPAQYERLLALSAMTTWTAARQQEHVADAAAYDAALAAIQAGLRSQHVEGDGRWSAARRARKVEKHLKAMAKAARQQAAAAEALRNAYAGHVAHVAALPGQREAKRQAKEVRKAGGRQAVAQIAAKSLHKSAVAAVPGPTGEMPGAPVETADPAPVRGINDLWKRGA